MDPQVIDALFDKAVEIVQSLPKTGPIQTGYEEKLAMYSLYKQATVGNVKGARPAMWDMLGRAKWDAWEKHKDLPTYEAKWQYVEELLRVLRKYSDKTIAQDLIKELESIEGGSSNVLMSGSFSKSHESDSDSESEEERSTSQSRISQSFQNVQRQQAGGSDADESGSEAERDDQMGEGLRRQPVTSNPNLDQSLLGRPQSSLSTNRYRTPTGGSVVLSPPPGPSGPIAAYPTHSADLLRQQQQTQLPYTQSPQLRQHPGVFVRPQSVQHGLGLGGANIPAGMSASVPNVQPMPSYETPSAFPGPSPPLSSSVHPPTSGMSASGGSSFTNVVHPYPENMYPGHPAYRATSLHSNSPGQVALPEQGSGISGIGVRSPLERAVENVQAHLTALQERMDILEGRSIGGTPYASIGGSGGRYGSPLGSPYSSYFGAGGRGRGYESSIWTWLAEFDENYFGWEHMGLWSVVLSPFARLTKHLGRILTFLLARRDRDGLRRRGLSPGLAILRRLLLDASFVLLVLYIARRAWRRSGVRRREVIHAMKGVWRAIRGQGSELTKQFVERGV